MCLFQLQLQNSLAIIYFSSFIRVFKITFGRPMKRNYSSKNTRERKKLTAIQNQSNSSFSFPMYIYNFSPSTQFMTLSLRHRQCRESYLEMQTYKTVIKAPFTVNRENQVFPYTSKALQKTTRHHCRLVKLEVTLTPGSQAKLKVN